VGAKTLWDSKQTPPKKVSAAFEILYLPVGVFQSDSPVFIEFSLLKTVQNPRRRFGFYTRSSSVQEQSAPAAPFFPEQLIIGIDHTQPFYRPAPIAQFNTRDLRE
jgi:hypothetical protein